MVKEFYFYFPWKFLIGTKKKKKIGLFGTALASYVRNENPMTGALISSSGCTVPSTATLWK